MSQGPYVARFRGPRNWVIERNNQCVAQGMGERLCKSVAKLLNEAEARREAEQEIRREGE